MRKFKIGDPCPTHGKPLIRRPDSFYWRGKYRDAAYCDECPSIWPIKDEEIPPLQERPSNDWPDTKDER